MQRDLTVFVVPGGRLSNPMVGVATDKGKEKVKATVHGGRWAVHKSQGKPGWTVTHLPSGLAAVQGVAKKQLADRAAKLLLEVADFDNPAATAAAMAAISMQPLFLKLTRATAPTLKAWNESIDNWAEVHGGMAKIKRTAKKAAEPSRKLPAKKATKKKATKKKATKKKATKKKATKKKASKKKASKKKASKKKASKKKASKKTRLVLFNAHDAPLGWVSDRAPGVDPKAVQQLLKAHGVESTPAKASQIAGRVFSDNEATVRHPTGGNWFIRRVSDLEEGWRFGPRGEVLSTWRAKQRRRLRRRELGLDKKKAGQPESRAANIAPPATSRPDPTDRAYAAYGQLRDELEGAIASGDDRAVLGVIGQARRQLGRDPGLLSDMITAAQEAGFLQEEELAGNPAPFGVEVSRLRRSLLR